MSCFYGEIWVSESCCGVLQWVQQPLWAPSFRQSFTGAHTLFIRLLQMPELVSFSSCNVGLLWGCLLLSLICLSDFSLRLYSVHFLFLLQHIYNLSFLFFAFVFPVLPTPLMCSLLTHPQTEDSQCPTSTEATFSTVTNGMWALSCVPRPLPPSANGWTSVLSAVTSDLCRSLTWCMKMCKPPSLPFSLFLCFSVCVWSSLRSQSVSDTCEHSSLFSHTCLCLTLCVCLSGKQPDGAVENNQNKGKNHQHVYSWGLVWFGGGMKLHHVSELLYCQSLFQQSSVSHWYPDWMIFEW